MIDKKFINGVGNTEIFLRVWDNVKYPKGTIQIFHGMAEHSGRYDDFAQYLNQNGYIVYANDHRGHGYSKLNNKPLAYIGEDGFNNIVEDEKIISEIIKNKYKNLPIYIFAHSFGSFIGQEYIIRYSNNIDGIILSGSAKQTGVDIKAGNILVSLQNKFLDDKSEAKLIDMISFGSYNNKIQNQKTKFDWLSRDNDQVDSYLKDKFCGYVSPINFYYNLFTGFKDLYEINRLTNISKILPILIISGDMDPVGKYGKSVRELYGQYKDLNIKDLSIKLFKDGRHELLNEINKGEVYKYVLDWIEER